MGNKAGRVVNFPESFQNFSRYLLGSILISGLSSCGVATQDTGPGDEMTLLNDFAVEGNITPVVNMQRIVLYQDGMFSKSGLFDISWDVDSSDPYSVQIHLSTDASPVLDEIIDGDQLFVSMQCGSSAFLNCDSLGDLRCAVEYDPDLNRAPGLDGMLFTPDDILTVATNRYFIRCTDGTNTIPETEITLRMAAASFPTVNLTNYIVFSACNQVEDSCSQALVQVQVLNNPP